MKRKAVIMAMIMCMIGTTVGGAGTVLAQAEAASAVDTTNAVEEGTSSGSRCYIHRRGRRGPG